MNKEELKIADELLDILDQCLLGDKITLSKERMQMLLDYITNLQEENHSLKELCDKYEEEHSTAFNLWKTNIIENVPALSDMQEKLEDYKTRNEKATKYIYDEMVYEDEDGLVMDYIEADNINELLNILNGGDE